MERHGGRSLQRMVALGKRAWSCDNFERNKDPMIDTALPRLPSMLSRAAIIALCTLFTGSQIPRSDAAAPMPARPKAYDVQLRYRIYAARNERLKQFDELVAFLNSVGFKKHPRPATEAEDPGETIMSGTIASGQARKLLGDSRIKTILLTPAGYKPPEEGPMKVQIEIAAGHPAERQLALYEQSRIKLEALGFRDNVGYDN